MTTLTGLHLFITIIAIAAGTVITRALPFFIFPPEKATPKFIKRLQFLLPNAVIGLLVVYCLRDVNILSGSRGIPEFIASAAIIFLHMWRKNTLLSIAGGTVLYMLLVQLVF